MEKLFSKLQNLRINAQFACACFWHRTLFVDGGTTTDVDAVGGWVAAWLGGWVMQPLCGSILQAVTCQILSMAENPRWSSSVALIKKWSNLVKGAREYIMQMWNTQLEEAPKFYDPFEDLCRVQ